MLSGMFTRLRCSFSASCGLALSLFLVACGGAQRAPATNDVGATEPAVAIDVGAPCGPDGGCGPGMICVAAQVMPHTGAPIMTCEVPCAADADCEVLFASMVPEAERACVISARTATDCQCAPGTPTLRCAGSSGDEAVRICDRLASFQDYGRPRCP